MAASSRGGQAMTAMFKGPRPASPFRTLAASPLQRRAYAAAAAATPPATPDAAAPPSTPQADAAPSTPTQTRPDYAIRAGIVLSRAPLLTRTPTKFETSFYLYQKRLNERLASSFHEKSFFKRDTTPALDWRLQLIERKGTIARDIGRYEGGKGGRGHGAAVVWDDELKIGDPDAERLTDPDLLRDRIISDAEMRVSEDGEALADAERIPVERPQPRTTEADKTNDTTRLDRKLDRTLYLVVQHKDGSWGFPTAEVEEYEALHEAAERALEETAGVDMNTWTVGRHPVAHLVRPSTDADKTAKHAVNTIKTFFLKGRIMAGQANIKGNPFGVTAFKWLTKDELATELPKYYYAGVKNALPSL